MTSLIVIANAAAERAQRQSVHRLSAELIEAVPGDTVMVGDNTVTVEGAGIKRRWQLDPRLRAIIGAGR
jgi:type IV secretory pathway protease TraF